MISKVSQIIVVFHSKKSKKVETLLKIVGRKKLNLPSSLMKSLFSLWTNQLKFQGEALVHRFTRSQVKNAVKFLVQSLIIQRKVKKTGKSGIHDQE